MDCPVGPDARQLVIMATLSPQSSPLVLRHPLAGHALGLGGLAGGH
jgi:hypothetical protein